MWTTLDTQWNIYEQCGRHISSGVYANNVNMCSSACGLTVDCIGFISGI